MIIVIGGLDLGFWPKSYFWPLNLETHLRATVRGRKRRAEDEIEIARISIESATHDVTSMYARQADGKIHYRVVDEHEGATLTKATRGTSINPLTLEQLGRRFLQAWPLLDIIEMNFGYCDLATALKFARGESAFYQQFGAYIEQAITDWVQKHREEMNEQDSEAEAATEGKAA